MKRQAPNRKFYKEDFKAKEELPLLEFLQKTYADRSRNTVKSYLKNCQILVNDNCQTGFDYPVKRGDKVSFLSIGVDKPNPNHKCKIVFEDDDIIVVDKKYGVLAMGRGKEGEETVYSVMNEHVLRRNKNAKVFNAINLERDCSGLMILAKNIDSQEILQEAWKRNQIQIKYAAVVEGVVEKDRGTVDSYLKESPKSLKVHSYLTDDNGGKRAVTRYQTLKRGEHYTLLEVIPDTNIKSQIRVQLASIKHFVAGDKKYGSTNNPLKRICLHAHSITFYHPLTKKKMEFSIDIPKDFL